MEAVDVLWKYWGYDAFRECQAEIIESVLGGHDTIGLLPTGGGKSITFQVPALMIDGLTVVVTPLISLMKDQVDNLRERGIRAACLHSGMSRPEIRLATDRLNLGKTKILYVSPEKLGRKEFMLQLKQWHLGMIVIDEAHCISQWGYDFRPSYLKLIELRKAFPTLPILALTATATPEVVKDIADKLGMRSPAVISRSFSRDNISYIVRLTDDKATQMIKVLQSTQGSAIVYVRSRKRTSELAELLKSSGISADFYHAGLETHAKTEKQDRWKSGETRVMVATNAFGMGIDKPDVRVVVHHDIPPTLEEYYQEAGRAGRDGKPSYAVLLASNSDKGLLKRRLSESFPGREYILNVYDKLGIFLNLSIGAGYDQVFEFNLAKFIAQNNLRPNPTLAALQTLTRAGAIEFNENFNSRSRVNIIADKRDLYELQTDDVTDEVLQWILRTYPGVFADYMPIDEDYLAIKARCTGQQVYDSMLQLSRMKIVSYIPKSNMPFIYYPTARDLAKHVEIPRAVYEDLQERAEKRLEAVRDYVFDDTSCRVKRMLQYFGEKEAKDCGKCDICRLKARAAKAGEIKQSVAERVDTMLRSHPTGISIDDLRQVFVPSQLTDAIEILREWAEDGKVSINDWLIRLEK